jgi:ATP-binding cassette subfamily C protein LapB
MDNNAEQGVINGLRASMKGNTLIIATHRMSLLEVVDRIILMEGGKIAADQPRREMLAKLRNQYQPSPVRAALTSDRRSAWRGAISRRTPGKS